MKRMLKIIGYVLGAMVIAIAAAIGYGSLKLNNALAETHNFPPTGIRADTSKIETGRRIVLIRNGCIHCHGLDLGGMLFIDDAMMGKVGGSNITPATLKDRTDEEMARAIKYGLNKENKSLRFMPCMEYQNLSKGDIASVIAYLRSVPAVDRPSPEIQFGPMAKILYALGQIPNLTAVNEFTQPDLDPVKPEEASTVEFGKYLIMTSCAGCHGMDLSGGTVPGAPPDWPPASPLNNLRTQGYDQEGFKKALRSGVRPNGKLILPPMSDATTRIMNDMELEAIWKYIETLGVQ